MKLLQWLLLCCGRCSECEAMGLRMDCEQAQLADSDSRSSLAIAVVAAP